MSRHKLTAISDTLHHILSKDTLSFMSYLAVAKARAKALKVASLVLPIPRPLLFIGEDACHKLCDVIINQGSTKVLIITDAILNKLGVPTKITDYLTAHHIGYHLYEDVISDPTFQVVEEGLTQSLTLGCDAIIAIGGGSVIDTAKMIALSQSNHCQPHALIGLLKARKKSIPLYCIPTTAGTGSEATLGAVISDDNTHQKKVAIDPKMIPLAAAIDPAIMQGMPAHITADTGIDALTHALEAWMSANASSETDYYATSATKAILQYLPIAYQHGDDLRARQHMGIAAHYAGLAFNKAGLGYVHAIAHQLGAYYGVAHGRANAIVLPYILDINRKTCTQKLATLARQVGILKDKVLVDIHDDNAVTAYFIAHIKTLIKAINIDPTINNMHKDDFDKIARAAAKEVRDTYAVPVYITPAQIKNILMHIKVASDACACG